MKRTELSEGVVRVVLDPEDAEAFEPAVFADAAGTFLVQTGFSRGERPVYRPDPAAYDGNETEIRF